jgi:hypothetical protein
VAGGAAYFLLINDSTKLGNTSEPKTGKVLSPSALLDKPAQYNSQTVTVEGRVLKSGATYLIVQSPSKTFKAVTLDFSKAPSIKASDYASTVQAAPDSSKDKPATQKVDKGLVKVTGEVVYKQDPVSHKDPKAPYIIVSSITR